jgi:circadian clock protein KaiC
LEVYPRLVSGEHRTAFERTLVPSGVAGVDALLGGGFERGSSALILGPAGTGKSTLAISFAVAAVRRKEKAALFIFDEELGLLYDRLRPLGMDLEAMQAGGRPLGPAGRRGRALSRRVRR